METPTVSQLKEASSLLIQAGEYEDAARAAVSLFDKGDRGDALVELVVALRRAGQREGALAAALLIPNEGASSEALGTKTELLAGAGCFKEAEAAIYAIGDTHRRNEASYILAVVLSAAGDFDSALRLAETIESTTIRQDTMHSLAADLEAAGEAANAAQLRASLGGEMPSRRRVVAKAPPPPPPDLEAALAEARSHDDEERRSASLLEIGTSLAGAGHVRAMDVLLEAAQAAREEYNPLRKVPLLLDIGQALAKAGDERALGILDEAIQAAPEIGSDRAREEAITRLAVLLVRLRYFDRAREVALLVESTYRRVALLSNVAANMADAGDERARDVFGEARDFAGAMVSGYTGSSALARLASAMAVAGDDRGREVFGQAIQVMEELSGDDRTLAQIDLTVSLARAGWLSWALAIAQGIDLFSVRAPLLRVLRTYSLIGVDDSARLEHALLTALCLYLGFGAAQDSRGWVRPYSIPINIASGSLAGQVSKPEPLPTTVESARHIARSLVVEGDVLGDVLVAGRDIVQNVTVVNQQEAQQLQTRARRFDTAFPAQVKTGDTVSLHVGVVLPDALSPFGDLEPDAVVTRGEATDVPFPLDPASGRLQEIVLDFHVNAPGFEPHSYVKSLIIDPEGAPAIAEIALRAANAGKRKIIIDVTWQGKPLGSVSLATEILPAQTAPAGVGLKLAFGSFYLAFAVGAA